MQFFARVFILPLLFFGVFTWSQSAFAFTIEPSAADVVLVDQTPATHTVFVRNTDKETASYAVLLQNLSFGERGEIANMEVMDASWIEVTPSAFILQPGQEQEVVISFSPPSYLQPIAFPLGVIVEEQGEEGRSNVLSSVLSYLFFSYQGEKLSPAATLTDFQIRFIEHTWIAAVAVQNSGEKTITPAGIVTLRDMFGRELETYAFNAQGNRVPPGVIRTIASPLAINLTSPWFIGGKITASVQLLYATSTAPLVGTVSWYTFPGWATMVCLGIGLLGLIVLFVIYKKRYRRQ